MRCGGCRSARRRPEHGTKDNNHLRASDLGGVTIGENNPEQTRAGLASKLVGASTRLQDGKFQDAIAKLVDFRTAVAKLASAPKPKISAEDAALLITDADNAIACIESLSVAGSGLVGEGKGIS